MSDDPLSQTPSGKNAGESQSPISDEAMARAQQEVNAIFQHANGRHPAMQTLRELCIERRARQLGGKI